jgi:hypothetical protein
MKKKFELDYHEGLSANQVKVILHELGLEYSSFEKWLYGQTCPVISRYRAKGKSVETLGVYEYDLFRWIKNKTRGIPLMWD